jgi:hypothetical protein
MVTAKEGSGMATEINDAILYEVMVPGDPESIPRFRPWLGRSSYVVNAAT